MFKGLVKLSCRRVEGWDQGEGKSIKSCYKHSVMKAVHCQSAFPHPMALQRAHEHICVHMNDALERGRHCSSLGRRTEFPTNDSWAAVHLWRKEAEFLLQAHTS